MTSTENEKIKLFIDALIEGMRPKLLDLSRRNPLLATQFSEKSHSNIRVVDENPSFLFEKLLTERMKLASLPPLESDPKDESTKKFINALSQARYTDSEYLEKLDKLDKDNAEYDLLIVERELKDKVRSQLDMPVRQTKTNLSLQQHAKNHHINPAYELSFDGINDIRFSDNDIQTLLLPEQFERRLNAILSKVRVWEQETGISVFHVAFGFLEWTDANSSNKTSFSPLILMPAVLEKIRTPHGVEFTVTCEGETPQENYVLGEKLKQNSIELPKVELDFSLENYIKNFEQALPKHLKWRVRNQVVFGVFPSARMAMYHDLETSKWDFGSSEVINTLFAGTENSVVAKPFADDYEVDDPKVESKVPFLITEADSSQFSTLVDLVNSKNLAVEGPPGSGKSQTIVNSIAAALYEGKKVLFVAEKSAALEVVKSRLEALHLGEFILPLLAAKSNRSGLIESLRERLDHGGYNYEDIKSKKSLYSRYRNQIKEYVDILAMKYKATGLTIHEILGQSLKYEKYLQSLPANIKNKSIADLDSFSELFMNDLKFACKELEEAEIEYSQTNNNWDVLNVIGMTPFMADAILENIAICNDLFRQNVADREKLVEFGVMSLVGTANIKLIINLINQYKIISERDVGIILHAISLKNNVQVVECFISNVESFKLLNAELDKLLKNPVDIRNIESIKCLIQIAKKYKIGKISKEELFKFKNRNETERTELNYICNIITQAVDSVPELENKSPFKIAEFCYVASLANKEVLAFRSKEFDDPQFIDYLLIQIKLAESLRTKESELSREFYVDRQLDLNEIKSHIDYLQSAGIFRYFSGKYRAAKRFYKSIAKENVFDYEKAICSLKTLFEYKKIVDKFNDDKNLQRLFIYKYEGIHTDFKIATETINYYKQIDDNFSGFEDLFLRDYLLNQLSEKIRSLPKLDLEKCNNLTRFESQTSIKSRLTELDNILSDLGSDLHNITQLLENFIATEYSIVELEELGHLTEQFQSRRKDINDEYVKEILGESFYAAEHTNLDTLRIIVDIYKAIYSLTEIDSKHLIEIFVKSNHIDLLNLLITIHNSDIECISSLDETAKSLGCNSTDLIALHNWDGIAKWAQVIKDDKKGLLSRSKLISYKKSVADYGFGPLLDTLAKECHGFKDLNFKVMALILNNLARSVFAEFGNILSKYTGVKLNKLREELAKIDREIQELASYHIAEVLVQQSNPPLGISRGPKRDWTEYSLIKAEIAKKQRYISPRELTRRAGKALLDLKPCWMMSPLAVAQYIRKGDIQFDLLIIDEASQMTPENAIGAISRCSQAMIVGDTNQLPPTSFFRKFIAVEEDDENDVVTEESILEIANNAFRPARRLRWHYRSEHSSLIAFSNKYIYGNDLTIYPSAYEDNPTMGVSLVNSSGLYSSGTNPDEAMCMVEHITAFMLNNPDRSLGVVTVNQKQRDLLEEEFEYALVNNPSLLEYLSVWEEKNDGLETFFIKNLENVQGDERDVIFIGTVYGPQSPGARVMQRFGPINGVAGKRRLNVLFTRAKKQIVTFSSMTSSDILAEETTNPGAYLLKKWLEYSATNILESGVATNKEPDSAFEEYVIAQIESMGCVAVPQVGVSGYFVDIGVRHPDWPHGYIMGVECDGASYHSSKSARDRDRLREEVLTKLGWRIYRIWSTDWFESPRDETEKLREAIKKRMHELKGQNVTYENVKIATNENTTAKNQTDENITSYVTDDLFSNTKKAITELEAKKLLTQLREQEIADDFENVNSERCILNDIMIELLIVERPTTPGEFRSCVPLSVRDKIDHQQMIFLNSILDIIRCIK